MKVKKMKRQSLRMFLLLLSFSIFPITIVYLSPVSPIMSLKAGVINLSVLTIISIFISGFIFRRSYCGWICPGGGCQLAAQAVNNKKIENLKNNWAQIIIVLIWIIAMITVILFGEQLPKLDVINPGAGRFAESDIRYFFPYIPAVIVIFLFVLIFGRRGFCNRGCWIYPIIAFSSWVSTRAHIPNLHVAVKNADNCTNCKLCNKNCPMSINVNDHVKAKSNLPNNCIQCGQCIDRCPKDVLSYSFGIER